ncbi:MAG: hypothetical protein IPK71_00400 [Myxococcales bacterium]|nr:hypothetical protein [Myxococcales bacterium]
MRPLLHIACVGSLVSITALGCSSEPSSGEAGWLGQGFGAGPGAQLIAANDVPNSTRLEVHNVADLLSAGCNVATDAAGAACRTAGDSVCRSRGFTSGTGPVEVGPVFTTIACQPIRNVASGIVSGPLGKERPMKLGLNKLGGYVAGSDQVIPPDVFYNGGTEPLLMRNVAFGSNYPGQYGYSRDACLYLNEINIWQSDTSLNGEISCTYSDVATDPTLSFRDAGIVVMPGDRIAFQATPRWGLNAAGQPRGLGYFSWANIEVSTVGSSFPVSRIRFPKWDTAYDVTGSLTIEAGNTTASPAPATVPSTKPKRNSNEWYVSPKATTIRGISLFMSTGEPAGVQSGKACLRIVQQGGANIVPPRCVEISADKFGPATFAAMAGSTPEGSAFLRFDQAVPAGALIGVDLSFATQSRGGLDLAAYVWLEGAANAAPAPAPAPTPATPAPSAGCSNNSLAPGQQLTPGQRLCSADGRFSLAVQADGNLVLKRSSDNYVKWHTNRVGASPRAVVQGDGNFVLYHGASAAWYTGTQGRAVRQLILQTDGNLVLYGTDGRALWHTNTPE